MYYPEQQGHGDAGFSNVGYEKGSHEGIDRSYESSEYPSHQQQFYESGGGGDEYEQPKLFCSAKLLHVFAVVLVFLGTCILLVGFFAMGVDDSRKIYESYDNVFQPMMKKMNRPYRRERWGVGFVGFGIWLGGPIALAGLIGVVDFFVKGAAKVFYLILCGLSVMCALATIVMAVYSIVEEDKLCESLLYATENWRACQGPYSTMTMKTLYSLEVLLCLVSLIILIYIFVLAKINRHVKKKRKLPGSIHHAGY